MQSPFDTKIEQLKNLNSEDSKKNVAEKSSILLWIATNHSKRVVKESVDIWSVRRLYFRESWEFLDEPVPTDKLLNLLNSGACKELKTFCGYVDPIVLDALNQFEPLQTIRLGLGKHINATLLIEKLNDRRLRHYLNNIVDDEEIIIHLKCGELDVEDLAPLPDIGPKLYISDVTDENAAWVGKAVAVLHPKPRTDPPMNSDYTNPNIERLFLPRSKITAVGVEAVLKGLFDAGISLDIEVSSPHITHLSKYSEIPGYEDKEEFEEIMYNKYNTISLYFDDAKCFTEFTDSILDDHLEDGYYKNKKYYQGGYHG